MTPRQRDLERRATWYEWQAAQAAAARAWREHDDEGMWFYERRCAELRHHFLALDPA